MARGRMIDNCISISEKINDLTLKEAFIYTWIIPHLDDWGRTTGSPRKLKALIFPMKKEVSINDVEKALLKFKVLELFFLENIDGELVLQQPEEEFNKHQSISEGKRAKSKYPKITTQFEHKNDNPQEMPEIPKKCQEIPAQVNLIKENISKENIRKDKEKEEWLSFVKAPCPKNKFPDDSIEILLSQLLFEKIKIHDEKCKEPDFQKWADSIDKLLRLDKRTKTEIEQVINWCQNDDFWHKNILSTSKLRDKFTQLFIGMNKGGGKNVNTGGSVKRFSNERQYSEEEQQSISSNFYSKV
jgi:hypothetical protein